MNKIGFFFFAWEERVFTFHSLLHSLAEVKWAEVKQQKKKKKKGKEKGLRKQESMWQISSGSQCLQLTPVLKYIPWAEFSSNFIEFPSFLKGKDSFYSYFPNSQTKLFPNGRHPGSSAVRCCRGSRESWVTSNCLSIIELSQDIFP